MSEDEQHISENEMEIDSIHEEQQVNNKSEKHSQKSFYSLPTNSEQQEFKIMNLFKNNLFKLKVDELLLQVKQKKTKTTTFINNALFEIKNCLESSQSMNVKNLSILDAPKWVVGLEIPFPASCPPKADSNLKFSFEAPSQIAVVGSFLLNLMSKKKDVCGNIDLQVEMPKELFQEKDFANYRYFYKRAFYLAVLTSHLQTNLGQKYNFAYEAFQNDENRPILIVTSSEKNENHYSKKGYKIRIFPCAPLGSFNIARLAPGRNNVKSELSTPPPTPTTTTQIAQSTSYYNAALLQEMHMLQHLNLLHDHLEESESLRDAILLFKVWLEQRNLAGGSEKGRMGYEFNGFLVSMIMTWLMRVKNAKEKKSTSNGKRIGKSFSSYQMFKVVMDLIATHDFSSRPLFLTDDGCARDESADFSEEAFLNNYDVAIVDPTGTFNLGSNISLSAMEEIQYEARLTLACLQDSVRDRFDDVFLKNVHQEWIKYDNVFKIPNLPLTARFSNPKASLNGLFKVLKDGLTDRTKCVAIWAPSLESWAPSHKMTPQKSIRFVTIGMVLDPDTSMRLVETGPASDDVEKVKEFSKLWGSRSEMRQFQDASVKQAVVFECDSNSLSQKSVIVARMAAFLLARHFDVAEAEGVKYWAGVGNSFVSLPISLEKEKSEMKKSFRDVMDAFKGISKELRSLDLPLSIYRLLPVTDSLAYCSAFIPQPTEPFELVSRVDPPQFLIEFENSGKWPDDIKAIETMKRAFYIRIVELIEKSNSETLASVLTDENNESFLELNHVSGYTFHVRIHHGRVGFLYEESLKKVTNSPELKSSLIQSYNIYKRRFVTTPEHYNLLGNLCLRYNFLGNTIQLFKRWLASHLLLDHDCGIQAQVAELLCAHVYTNPSAFGVPCSGWTGFVRVLDLIQDWKWNLEPLIVNLTHDSEMSQATVDEINDNFEKSSQKGNGYLLFIASEMDRNSTNFGSLSVPSKIIERFILLARHSLKVVQQKLTCGADNDVSQIFTASSEGFNAILHLDCSKLLKYFNSITFDASKAPRMTSEFKNLQNSHDKQLLELSRIDPLMLYLKELTSIYGELAYFFADFYGGDKIAIVWKEPYLQDGPFKINMAYNAISNKDRTEVQANKKAMLAEMARIGSGICQGIEFC